MKAMSQAMISITLVLLVFDLWEMGNMIADNLSKEMTIITKPEAQNPRILKQDMCVIPKSLNTKQPPEKNHNLASYFISLPRHCCSPGYFKWNLQQNNLKHQL